MALCPVARVGVSRAGKAPSGGCRILDFTFTLASAGRNVLSRQRKWFEWWVRCSDGSVGVWAGVWRWWVAAD